MGRLLWVGTTFVVFFILYIVLAKGGIVEGQKTRRTHAPTPQKQCSKIFSKFNPQNKKNDDLKKAINPSCLTNPKIFQNCINIIYKNNLPMPSTNVAVESINKCMIDQKKYSKCFNDKMNGYNWTKDNWVTKTYDEILKNINNNCN